MRLMIQPTFFLVTLKLRTVLQYKYAKAHGDRRRSLNQTI